MTIPEQFRHEYDLAALCLVRPKGQEFSMRVPPRYREHYEQQRYEGFTAALLGRILASKRLFMDVGANFGFFTLLAGARHPGLETVAFEPVPETFAALRSNVELQGLRRVALHQAAVSDTDGTDEFTISLAADNCGFYPHPNAPPLRTISVRTVQLDSFFRDREPLPTVVKIDTDGHELPVLKGMRETIERFPDLSFFLEFNPKMQRAANHEPEDLLREIERLGFAAFLLDDTAQRAYRVGTETRWRKLMKPQGYANLYCLRRQRALSLCFFLHSTQLTGAERSLLELADELVVDHGVVCTAVLPGTGPLADALQRAGVAVIPSSYRWWCNSSSADEPFDLSRLAPSAAELVESLLPVLEAIDPDAVVSQTMVIPWGAAAAALLGKPHVWSVCELGEIDHGLRFHLPIAVVLREIADSSRYVFTASRWMREVLFPSLGDDRCAVLYRHIPMPDPGALAPSPSFFRIPGSLRVGLFGTITESKGQADAVQAVLRLLALGMNVELLLAGESEPAYRNELDELILRFGGGAHIHFSGFLVDPYPVMAESDILLACSRNEAFGRSAVEAMLLGKPLVFAAAGGYLEYLDDGRTGLAYPAGDDEALAEKIASLASDHQLRASLGTAAAQRARALFTRGAYGGLFYRKLRTLLAESSGATAMPTSVQRLLLAALVELAHKKVILEERLDKAATTIANLTTVEQAHSDASRALETVLGTRSWRWTAPLRALFCQIDKLRRHRPL